MELNRSKGKGADMDESIQQEFLQRQQRVAETHGMSLDEWSACRCRYCMSTPATSTFDTDHGKHIGVIAMKVCARMADLWDLLDGNRSAPVRAQAAAELEQLAAASD
jgi:hypothetical protein